MYEVFSYTAVLKKINFRTLMFFFHSFFFLSFFSFFFFLNWKKIQYPDECNFCVTLRQFFDAIEKGVRSELKFGVNSNDNLAKYKDFSFQPIRALELRSMPSELKIQVSILTIANEWMWFNQSKWIVPIYRFCSLLNEWRNFDICKLGWLRSI